jgi:hypothetical protein
MPHYSWSILRYTVIYELNFPMVWALYFLNALSKELWKLPKTACGLQTVMLLYTLNHSVTCFMMSLAYYIFYLTYYCFTDYSVATSLYWYFYFETYKKVEYINVKTWRRHNYGLLCSWQFYNDYVVYVNVLFWRTYTIKVIWHQNRNMLFAHLGCYERQPTPGAGAMSRVIQNH